MKTPFHVPQPDNPLLEGLKQLVRDAVREEIQNSLKGQNQQPEPLLLDTEAAAKLLAVPETWLAAAARNLIANQLLSGSANTDQVSAQEIEDLNHRIAVLERAIERQLDTVSNLRAQYSVFVCESKAQRDRYIEIERRIARAVRELAAANEAEVAFFDELHAAGVTPRFRPMRVSVVGLPSDPNSVATFHHREVKQFCPEALA